MKKLILVILVLVSVLALVSVVNAQEEPVLDFLLFAPVVQKAVPPEHVRPTPTPAPTPTEPSHIRPTLTPVAP